MSIQILTSVIYEIVSHAWSFASIATKYYIAAVLIFLYSQQKLELEEFQEKIKEDARIVITGFVAFGTAFFVLNFKPEPVFTVFSQLIALGYLGYLFWEY